MYDCDLTLYLGRALTELAYIDNDFADAYNEISNTIYNAAISYELWESIGKVQDSGNHMRQELAFISQCIMFDHWQSDAKSKLFGDKKLHEIAERWRAAATTSIL